MKAIAQCLYQHNDTYYLRIRSAGLQVTRSLGSNLSLANSIYSQTKPIFSALNQLSRDKKTSKNTLADYATKTLRLVGQLRTAGNTELMDKEIIKLQALVQNAEKNARFNVYQTKQTLGVSEKHIVETCDEALNHLDNPDIQEQIEQRYIDTILSSPAVQEAIQENPENKQDIINHAIQQALQLSQEETEKMRLTFLTASSRKLEAKSYISALETKLTTKIAIASTKQQSAIPSVKQAPSSLTPKLSEALETYIQKKSETKRPLSARNENEFKQSVEEVIEVIGDRPLNEYTTHDFQRFEVVMLKIPSRYRASRGLDINNTPKKFYGRSIEDISKLGVKENLFGNNTISQKLQNIQSLYKYFQIQSPLQNFSFSTSPDTKRRIFSISEIQRLVNFTTSLPEDAKWYVLCCLFTGARPNEIQQLTINDIKQDSNGIWIFDINNDGDKTLKNMQSIRDIPIHSKLITAGFLPYAASKTDKIFPTAPMSSDWANYTSIYVIKPFLEKNKIDKKTKDGEIVFYSLRHTFITYLLNEKLCEIRFVQEMVGHEKLYGMTNNYTHGKINSKTLKEEIEKLYEEIIIN